jgi:hypothetical protein
MDVREIVADMNWIELAKGMVHLRNFVMIEV